MDSTIDVTVDLRKSLVAAINVFPGTREALEAEYGQVYTTDQLSMEFTVLCFAAPYVVVKRKSDGVKGSLMFQHTPRFYFRFVEDR
jgi:hypothetical protein